MDKEKKEKIWQIYIDFTIKIGNLLNKKRGLFKLYRQKLEEAKIKEVRDFISKQ